MCQLQNDTISKLLKKVSLAYIVTKNKSDVFFVIWFIPVTVSKVFNKVVILISKVFNKILI